MAAPQLQGLGFGLFVRDSELLNAHCPRLICGVERTLPSAPVLALRQSMDGFVAAFACCRSPQAAGGRSLLRLSVGCWEPAFLQGKAGHYTPLAQCSRLYQEASAGCARGLAV